MEDASRGSTSSSWRGAVVLVGGVIGAVAGEIFALVLLLPVALLLAPLHLLLRPVVAGAIAGLFAFWVGERAVKDGRRGRLLSIVGAAISAAVLYEVALQVVVLMTFLPLTWFVAGWPVRPLFVGVVGVVAGMAAWKLRRTQGEQGS